MADDAAAASTDDTQLTFNIKSANDQKFVVTVPANSTVADLKTKLSTSEFADIPAERQRLIYSGRVLKDHDTLSGVKIKDGHTVHLVKGAASNARQNPANQGTGSASASGTPAPQVPTNIAAGTGNSTLAGLTGARYAGFHGLPGADSFGPDGGLGPPPDPDQLLQMMDNPMFLSQMNEAMNNPAVIEMMAQNPMIRNNPMMAEMIRNPEMRRMMFNPEMMRMQLRMQQAMGGGGGQRFTAPGATDNTPQAGATNTGNSTATPNQQNPAQDPLAGLFGAAGGAGGAGGAGANPFANLFGPGAFAPQQQNQNNSGTTGAATGTTQGAEGTRDNATSPPPNPFGNLFGAPPSGGQPNPIAEMTAQLMQDPEAMRAAMNMFGQMNGGNSQPAFNPFGAAPGSNPSPRATGGAAGAGSQAPNPFAALFGPGGGFGTPPPQDSRPPEEVYEIQLRQLNEMGFFEFDRNVSALRRSGGNVQGAIEFLLSGDV
ncbi:hypothetical protein BU24DRAFT_420584 [Aaosphaeria arxii CBS 175.79]|uniref:Ubiquitin-domain-containing protein n=1 Tax=Aaosphaeria arxii CBS 175.79 TaxID=1450172 RepID=A0A6A5XZ41_9PLEO|nr:uncharacterized protein BU24DRAFT_420584 [Aaosphaeria arxii CBS 175.79]KAF2017554.1 hypothetical protein BU24DRAFT_420584 [Aaosphaeria arxii CBS 175.79]